MQRISSSHRQSGAILVVSLLLLLVMTLLGLTAMQVARMEERMAGNTRDINLAFQGAEAGLRDGEGQIETLLAEPPTCSASPCEVWQRSIATLASDLRDKDKNWWLANAQLYGQDGVQEVEVAWEPRFLVQEIAFIEDDLNEGEGVDTGRNIYRVVATSPGATDTARATIESTYAKRFN